MHCKCTFLHKISVNIVNIRCLEALTNRFERYLECKLTCKSTTADTAWVMRKINYLWFFTDKYTCTYTSTCR